MRTCIVCGAKKAKGKRSNIERHHISRHPEAVILLCCDCHRVITNYERGEEWERTEQEDKIIAVYNGISPSAYTSQDSEVVSLRISTDVYNILNKLSTGKKMNVSAFVKWKIEEYISKVNAVYKPVNPENVPIYNPAVHKTGDTVRVRKGKRLVETVVPELDADGHPMYED